MAAIAACAERTPERRGVVGTGIHLVMDEPAEQPPLRHLGAAQAHLCALAVEDELGATQQAAHPRDILLDTRVSH